MNPKVVVGGISAAVVGIAVPLYVGSEGWKNDSYKDIVGIWTVCAGSTEGVTAGMHLTDQQCMDRLVKDFETHFAQMRVCAPRIVEAPPHVQAAALDFGLNVGTGKFCGSTLAKKLNAGDWAGSCNEYPRWVMKGNPPVDCRDPKNKCSGLAARRMREKTVCEGKTLPPVSLGVIG